MMLFFHVSWRSEEVVTKWAGGGASTRAMRSAAVVNASGGDDAAMTRINDVSWLTCSGVASSDDFTSLRRGRYLPKCYKKTVREGRDAHGGAHGGDAGHHVRHVAATSLVSDPRPQPRSVRIKHRGLRERGEEGGREG